MGFEEIFSKYFMADTKAFTKKDLELFFELGKREALEAEEIAESKIRELIGKLEGVLNE